jgi:hypothetical protein
MQSVEKINVFLEKETSTMINLNEEIERIGVLFKEILTLYNQLSNTADSQVANEIINYLNAHHAFMEQLTSTIKRIASPFQN